MSPARSLPFCFALLPVRAIGANVCLCAGLTLNGYAWWIGWRSGWISRIIFAAGMLLAVAPAGVVLVRLKPFCVGAGAGYNNKPNAHPTSTSDPRREAG